jgi:hypothetical protein
LFSKIRGEVDACFGGKAHVLAGKTIFSTEELIEDVVLESRIHKTLYTIVISTKNKVFFSGEDLQHGAKMADQQVIHMLLNNIIKDAFRSTQLRQIGTLPRFFDMDKAIPVAQTGLLACPGFRAAAYSYTSGLTLVMDSVSKFIQSRTVYDVLQEKFGPDYKASAETREAVRKFL